MKRYIVADIVRLEDEPEETKTAIASNPHTRPDKLRTLYECSVVGDGVLDHNLGCALAGNPSTPVDILVTMARDYVSAKLLYILVQNPSLPEAERLSLLKDSRVASFLADSDSCPVELLITLAADENLNASINTYIKLAENPRFPRDLAQQLIDDYDLTTEFYIDFVSAEEEAEALELTEPINAAFSSYPKYRDCYIELQDDQEGMMDDEVQYYKYTLYLHFELIQYRDPAYLYSIIEQAADILDEHGCSLSDNGWEECGG